MSERGAAALAVSDCEIGDGGPGNELREFEDFSRHYENEYSH